LLHRLSDANGGVAAASRNSHWRAANDQPAAAVTGDLGSRRRHIHKISPLTSPSTLGVMSRGLNGHIIIQADSGVSTMPVRRWTRGAACVACAVLSTSLSAQQANQTPALPQIEVNAKRTPPKRTVRRSATTRATARTPAPAAPAAPTSSIASVFATPPVVQRFDLPQESFSTTAKQIEETINLKDPEDAIKYFPSLFVRKRNDGDNQAVLATRTWGLNSSARTLIYEDDLLVSALIGNNNSGASPHWNLITPEAISRIDFLNGPYAAMYPGNSMGGVLLVTTKMPDKFETDMKETVSVQPWNQYATKNTYVDSQTSAFVGNRNGNLSWFVAANFLDGFQQPLTYTTNGSAPAGTTGTIPALTKQGVVADVVGTGALIHTQQTSANFKMAYDLTNTVQATYALGIWNNIQTSNPQTYLTNTTTGWPTFGGVSGFASNEYIWNQTHMSNAVSLKSNGGGVLDFDLSASSYNYLQDIMVNPFTVAPFTAGSTTATGNGYSQNGKITRNDGTNWQNADAKFIWRPQGPDGQHEISYGLHGDQYDFQNPVYANSVWNLASTGTGIVYSDGAGKTETGALWAQDAWRFASGWKLTLGGRLETWRAFDGFNLNTATSSTGAVTSASAVNQPELSSTNFSPKVSLSYDPNKDWNITANFGEAYRYPTVTELYQNVSSGGIIYLPNPNLTPEQDLNSELNIERHWQDGRVRLTLFDEHTNNAIISQSNTVTSATGAQSVQTSISNVAAIRMDGVELSADKDNVWFRGLQTFGSVTYVNSEILSDPSWSGTNPLTGRPDTVVGKWVPYVPDWRARAGITYRWADGWAFTFAGRYSGKQYSTLDNTDIIPHVYGAFDKYVVFDTKLHYEATKNITFDAGIDNLFNEQYFLFHPFPGRTYVLAGKYQW
jgi:iron complex outermembrane receptor protein